MPRSSGLIWLILLVIVLLPTAGGRILLDIAGGIAFLFLALPIVLIGAGWISWKIIQSKMVICDRCGASSFTETNQCPICGATKNKINSTEDSTPASSVTIDIVPKNPDN